MSKYWNETVRNIKPYVPGEQPRDKKYIKLNTNENPYPPSPMVLEAIRNAADATLRLYPDPTSHDLIAAIAKSYGLKEKQVFVGNGSDELLAFTYMAFFSPDKKILFPDITYSFYPVYASLFNIPYETIPLDEEFNIPEEMFFKENGGIIISNPKSPTAQDMPLKAIEAIIRGNPDSVVVIDEAYIDFGGESAVSLIDKYPNLLIIQTLSKSRALAGLRVGFALGQEDLIEGLDRIKNSFNSYTMDRLALAGATAAFKDEAYYRETTRKVIATRDRISTELCSLGYKVQDSKANFIFVSHPAIAARRIFEILREKGVLVRHFSNPRIENYLRISIGTDEEMDFTLQVLKEIL